MNTIKYAARVSRQLSKLPQQDSRRIVLACQGLANMPNCKNVKALINQRYDYRLRVGDYRVFFDFDGVIRIIYIEEIKKRNEITY